MKVKALLSFCGRINMVKGEVADIGDPALAERLISAGYVEKLGKEKTNDNCQNTQAGNVSRRKHG